MRRGVYLAVLSVVTASVLWSQTTISTDGDVEAQGFVGDGSQVTGVDAETLDSMDSSAFAEETDLQNVEAMLVALQAQVDEAGPLYRLGAPVPETGQTMSYTTGDDGDLERGVTWPNPRFTDNGNGTVTDNLTGLIWLKKANCIGSDYPEFDTDGTSGDGQVTWHHALDFVAGVNAGTYSNCAAGKDDWRLANVWELQSLVHYGLWSPAVPDTAGTGQWSEGDPFSGVQSAVYWSSTTWTFNTNDAWNVSILGIGSLGNIPKTSTYFVWPVRGGQ